MKMTNLLVSMCVREIGTDDSVVLTFAVGGDERTSLRLTIGNCEWQLSVSRAWTHISESGAQSESVTRIAGIIRQKEETACATIVIDCGRTSPLLTICLSMGNRSFDTRHFEITHALQEKIISLLSTTTYIKSVRWNAPLQTVAQNRGLGQTTVAGEKSRHDELRRQASRCGQLSRPFLA